MLPNTGMRYKSSSTVKITTFLIIHAAAAGVLTSPSVIVTRNMPTDINEIVEWLPKDNQTLYRLKEGEVRRLELNTSSINQNLIYMTISPCTQSLKWELYHANSGSDNLQLLKYQENDESIVFSTTVSKYDRYILQLSSVREGSAAVSVRGESPKTVRLRLRARSKRRLAANWDPSPIDPHATLYCVVASHRRNYTSLCAAQHDFKVNRQNKPNILETDRRQVNTKDYNGRGEVDNSLEKDFIGENMAFSAFDGNLKKNYKRKKFSRSTRVTDEDPMVTCVGDRTHHLIENLDPAKMYYISIFGIGSDRRAGSLLAAGSVRPRTSSAKRLRENIPLKTELRGRKSIFYYKSSLSSGTGIWVAVTNCGESIDVEVSAKGKRLKFIRNIGKHLKIYIPAPLWMSSIQETSDEGLQFDSSSSEETKLRYVIKVTPTRKDMSDKFNEIEVVASSKRWGVNIPELAPHDGATVRELRPKRSCHSIDIAFLPATHENVNVIRYCITAKEITIPSNNDQSFCARTKQTLKTQCVSHIQRPSAKVIIHTINGLRADRKYAIQVVASIKGNGVPYNILFADTNVCDNE